MDLWAFSEFTDEYQDWLDGSRRPQRSTGFDAPVGDLEHRAVLSVAPEASLRSAIDLMNAHDSGAVLVMQHQGEPRLVGIFTERDVLRRAIARNVDLDHTPVSALMTSAPDVLDATATLAQALRTMSRSRYRHLPVVDSDGTPTAVVSMRRIIQFVCEAFPEEILNAPPERHSEYPALEGA